MCYIYCWDLCSIFQWHTFFLVLPSFFLSVYILVLISCIFIIVYFNIFISLALDFTFIDLYNLIGLYYNIIVFYKELLVFIDYVTIQLLLRCNFTWIVNFFFIWINKCLSKLTPFIYWLWYWNFNSLTFFFFFRYFLSIQINYCKFWPDSCHTSLYCFPIFCQLFDNNCLKFVLEELLLF